MKKFNKCSEKLKLLFKLNKINILGKHIVNCCEVDNCGNSTILTNCYVEKTIKNPVRIKIPTG